MTLSQMKIGKTKKITFIDKNSRLGQRLLNMGYRVGLDITIILSAHGLLEIRIGETLLGIKKGDTYGILVG